jgi:hypothetical protein
MSAAILADLKVVPQNLSDRPHSGYMHTSDFQTVICKLQYESNILDLCRRSALHRRTLRPTSIPCVEQLQYYMKQRNKTPFVGMKRTCTVEILGLLWFLKEGYHCFNLFYLSFVAKWILPQLESTYCVLCSLFLFY